MVAVADSNPGQSVLFGLAVSLNDEDVEQKKQPAKKKATKKRTGKKRK